MSCHCLDCKVQNAPSTFRFIRNQSWISCIETSHSENSSTGVSPPRPPGEPFRHFLRRLLLFLLTNEEFTQQDRETLTKQVARELRPKINIPMLEDEQELLVLEELCIFVFASLSGSAFRQQFEIWFKRAPTINRTLFGAQEYRHELAHCINAIIDVLPFLDESGVDQFGKKQSICYNSEFAVSAPI